MAKTRSISFYFVPQVAVKFSPVVLEGGVNDVVD